MAVYNEERHLEACLSSLTQQSYQPIELIVVDDGSKDQTRSIAAQFKEVVLVGSGVLQSDPSR